MSDQKRAKGGSLSSAGWRAGLGRCIGAVAFIALFNILFLSIAAPNVKKSERTSSISTRAVGDGVVGVHRGPDAPGGGSLFEGSCETAKDLSVWVHLGINIMSTVLLASGNYAQQILTAPTRTEIDRAHRKDSWLHLGILSYRNLRGISKRRVLAWAILALTSAPIHLL